MCGWWACADGACQRPPVVAGVDVQTAGAAPEVGVMDPGRGAARIVCGGACGALERVCTVSGRACVINSLQSSAHVVRWIFGIVDCLRRVRPLPSDLSDSERA